MLGSSYVAIGISRSCNAGDCAWVTDFGSKIVKPFNAGTTPTPTPVPTKTPAPTPIPTSTSGTLLINSNPSGAAVSIANTGKNLGVTPYSINPAAYPSPTFLRLSKSGYQSINFPIYNWMVPPRYTSLSYNLKPLSTSTPTPTPTPVPTKTPAPTPVPTSTSGALLINSNPSGATVTITNTGQNLGVTPVYINPKIYPSPTFLRLTKAGYQPKNIAIYNWMVPPAYISLSYTLQPQ
ncbi:MAG: PEGA domain-containing protein [Candidatus Methanoperedens sp.]|nr:PEGA domain-containing protein [Candidatus Methanoperedens sp.]